MSKDGNNTLLKKKRNKNQNIEELIKDYNKKKITGESFEIYDNQIPQYNNSNKELESDNEEDKVPKKKKKLNKSNNSEKQIKENKLEENISKDNISEENKKYKEKVELLERYKKNLKNKKNLVYILDYVKAKSSMEYKNWPKRLNYNFIKISSENYINEETEKCLIHFKEIINFVKYNYVIYEIELENNIIEYVHYLHIKLKTAITISVKKFYDFSIILSKDIKDINLILCGIYGGHKTVLRIYTYINRNKNTYFPMIIEDIKRMNSIITSYNDIYKYNIKEISKENINILNLDNILPEDKFSSEELFM